MYKNFSLSVDQDNILWIIVDKQNESVNSFSRDVLEEFNLVLDDVIARDDIVGIVIRSGKPKGFIAGADIKQLSGFTDVHDAVNFVRYGQVLFDRLQRIKIPTVALIEGFCMGGGLEMSLACRYRVARDTEDTKIGLPEVMLGIHPGWGGTVRLPSLIGAPMAMDLMLSGRSISAKAAKKMGVVDAAVPARECEKAARYYILKRPSAHYPGVLGSLTNSFLVRPILGNIFRKKVSAKASPNHYPAPFAMIDNWVRHGVSNHDEAMITEANSIGELLLTQTPKNLIRVFNLSESMKGLAKDVSFKPKHIHVIGAGVMGGDIAAWCVLRGMTVTLEDREGKFLSASLARAAVLFKKKLKDRMKVRMAMDRLIPDVVGEGAKKADVIIEAIFENLEAKQHLFQRLEKEARPDAVLASNTSSIPLDEISSAMRSPERLVGIHFFNPVDKMPLVEVVKSDRTHSDTVKKALAFVVKISRQPIVVKSSPGFLVNRVLTPYLMESMTLLEEGVPAHVIDKAAVKFGMPMGPVELADTVGLDICLSVAKNLSKYHHTVIPERLIKMVEAGQLGRKSGSGFYTYKNGKRVKEKMKVLPTLDAQTIQQRLIGRMLNESVACLREHVIGDQDMLDAGMIFGTGFAPFTGGPLNYARSVGIDKIVSQLRELETQYGERFAPDAGWELVK